MKKRKLITASGAIALVIPMLYIGFYFLYWGAWNHLIRGGTNPWGLDYLMLTFGGFMTIIAITIILKLVAYLSPKTRTLKDSEGGLFG